MLSPLTDLAHIRNRKTGRFSSWDTTGRNADRWFIPASQSCVLADIRGPGLITHIWMTQGNHYRECLLRFTWDDVPQPSVLVPLGDFFCLGNGIVNSFQSLLFSASTRANNQFNQGCALNCYAPMPFRRRALIELVNESPGDHMQYFYVDYETLDSEEPLLESGYFHAEFRRTNPFGGWAHEIIVNTPEADVVNKELTAWENNYVITEILGRGHYIGCNLSVTNLQGTWWGEGDDMIWVDGYKWPPDLHGTGSEDYLNQAWGMQPNAFLRNGSSIFENHTNGYQTSYVFHIENPVRFQKSLKATIEHGHGNHLQNEMSSVAYWYADRPSAVAEPPPMEKRMPVLRDPSGKWIRDPRNQCPGKPVKMTPEMEERKKLWPEIARQRMLATTPKPLSKWHSGFVNTWSLSKLLPPGDVSKARCVRLSDDLDWRTIKADEPQRRQLVNVHAVYGDADGLAYVGAKFEVAKEGEWIIHLGHDAPARVFLDGKAVLCEPKRVNPAPPMRSKTKVALSTGIHEIMVAIDTDAGMGWGFYFSFEVPEPERKPGIKPAFPQLIKPAKQRTKRR